jgi:hypothetical protein
MTNWRYGLDDRGIKARFPAGVGDFSLLQNIQKGPGVHQASIPHLMSTNPPFVGHWGLGVVLLTWRKSGQIVKVTTRLHIASSLRGPAIILYLHSLICLTGVHIYNLTFAL